MIRSKFSTPSPVGDVPMGREDRCALLRKPVTAQSSRSYSSLKKSLDEALPRRRGRKITRDLRSSSSRVGNTFTSRYPTGAGAGGALAYGRGTGREAAANRRTTASGLDGRPSTYSPTVRPLPLNPPPTRHLIAQFPPSTYTTLHGGGRRGLGDWWWWWWWRWWWWRWWW